MTVKLRITHTKILGYVFAFLFFTGCTYSTQDDYICESLKDVNLTLNSKHNYYELTNKNTGMYSRAKLSDGNKFAEIKESSEDVIEKEHGVFNYKKIKTKKVFLTGKMISRSDTFFFLIFPLTNFSLDQYQVRLSDKTYLVSYSEFCDLDKSNFSPLEKYYNKGILKSRRTFFQEGEVQCEKVNRERFFKF